MFYKYISKYILIHIVISLFFHITTLGIIQIETSVFHVAGSVEYDGAVFAVINNYDQDTWQVGLD